MPLKDLLTVELQVALDSDPADEVPVWTTIASNTTKKLRSWQIRRGRNSTLDTFQAGTASFVLDNRDRTFDPLHAGGAHYGKLKPGKRVRLRVTYNATTYTRFDGYVDGWPQTYPSPTVKDSLVELRATDGFKRLARVELRPAWDAAVNALPAPPRLWATFDESAGTVASDSSGNGNHGEYDPGVEFGAAGAIVGSNGTGITAPDYFDSVLGGTAAYRPVFPASAGVSGTEDFTVAFWITGGLIEGQVAVGQAAPYAGDVSTMMSWGFYRPLGSTGTRFWVWDKDYTSFARTSSASIANIPAATTFVAGVREGNTVRMYINGVLIHSATSAGTLDVAAERVSVAPGFGPVTTDDLLIIPAAVSTADLLALYQAGATPWEGDTPGARMDRVLNLLGWSDRDLDTGSATLSPALVENVDALSHLQEVAVTEGGRFFMSRSGSATLVGRDEFWSEAVYTTSQATFSDDGAGLPYTGFGWDYSDQKVRNDIRITPQETGAQIVGDSTSQVDYGILGHSQASLEQSAAKVRGQAEWLLARHKDAAFEVDRLDIDPLRSPSTLFPVVLAAELGYRYSIERTPQGVGAQIAQEVHLEGTSEAGDSSGYRFTWQLSRAEPAVWVLGTGVLGSTTRLGY